MAQDCAHLVHLRESGTGQWGVGVIALQSRCGVENGFAMASDK